TDEKRRNGGGANDVREDHELPARKPIDEESSQGPDHGGGGELQHEHEGEGPGGPPASVQSGGDSQGVDPVAEVRDGLGSPKPHEGSVVAEVGDPAARWDESRTTDSVQRGARPKGDADVAHAEDVVQREPRGKSEDVTEEGERGGGHDRRVVKAGTSY